MDIVYVLYSLNTAHIIYKRRNGETFRDCLHENIGRFAQNLPGANGDQNRDTNREQRVNDGPTGNQY